MKKSIILLLACVILTGCTTPKTVLKNPETEQVVVCGGSANGSMAGGIVGYHIQKSNDRKCKMDYLEQGFKVLKEEK